MSVVELRDMRFCFPGEGAFGLSVDDLVIERSEHTACIGPSGCGKTTLINLITGVIVPDAGTVTLADQTISSMAEPERRAFRLRRVGMVFQSFALLDHLSVLDNILLPYHLSGLALDNAARDRAETTAGALGIAALLRRRPARLSQGERQRTAIARALVTDPELVVCDEPTGSLDPARSEGVIDLLLERASDLGATLLVVTHDHTLLPRFVRTIDMSRLAPGVTA